MKERTTMVVLARPRDASAAIAVLEPRAPWQTRFARVSIAPLPARPAQPIAIPVIGGRPIAGEHLVRAPWAEPLAAFAGVVVETQRVPQGWLSGPPVPSVAPARSSRPVAIPVVTGAVADRPIPFVPPTRRSIDGLVAIPVARTPAPGIAARDAQPLPGRIIPFPVAPAAVAPQPVPAAVAVAVMEAPAPVVEVASAPATTVAPAAIPAVPGRRGFIARTLSFTLTMLASFAVLESLSRVGRR